jgi:predicted Zn-dependent protease
LDKIANLEALLGKGMDSALLRFSLGGEYLNLQEYGKAVEHLRAAVTQDADYSAAWKLLGKSLAGLGDMDGAAVAYVDGIAAAERRGDVQAAKEMAIFLRRLQKRRE